MIRLFTVLHTEIVFSFARSSLSHSLILPSARATKAEVVNEVAEAEDHVPLRHMTAEHRSAKQIRHLNQAIVAL